MDSETWMDIGYVVGMLMGAGLLDLFGWVPVLIVAVWIAVQVWRREHHG